ncbi:MAG: type II toxin-antitoxin system VapC family toxin [Verrucomicrobiae bacterium]|nr:type II toxin-antitoxin system VapC family toxin [Verrucomicrobiae bacterium]
MTVVDASVAIKWFLVEPETPAAMRVARAALEGDDVFAVPELFYYEVYAVVTRRHADPARWATAGMRWLLNLPLRRMPMTVALAEGMREFTALGLTGCDAAYAALARAHGGRWLTFDRRAATLLGAPDWVVAPG